MNSSSGKYFVMEALKSVYYCMIRDPGHYRTGGPPLSEVHPRPMKSLLALSERILIRHQISVITDPSLY